MPRGEIQARNTRSRGESGEDAECPNLDVRSLHFSFTSTLSAPTTIPVRTLPVSVTTVTV